MFAPQLTNTPAATGVKIPFSVPETPSLDSVTKTDFTFHLGQAQTVANGCGLEKQFTAPSSNFSNSKTPITMLPLERVPQSGLEAGTSSQRGTLTLINLDPAITKASVTRTPDSDALVSSKRVMQGEVEVGAAIQNKDPELLDLDPAITNPSAPLTPVSNALETLETHALKDVAAANNANPAHRTFNIAAEAALTQTASFDIETGATPILSGLTPHNILDQNDPYQTVSTRRLGQNIKTNTDNISIVLMPTSMQLDSIALEYHDMDEIPEQTHEPKGVPLDTDLLTNAGMPFILPNNMPGERDTSPLLISEANVQVKIDVTTGPAELTDQAAESVQFTRALAEVSASSTAVAAPTQHTQTSGAAPQVQTQAALDMSQANWAERLIEDVSLQPMGRGETMTLTLTPDRLGTMQVRLEMQDGQTNVHFITDNPETARLLNEAQPRLADLMSRAGVDLGSQSTGTGQGSQHDQPTGQQDLGLSNLLEPPQEIVPEITDRPTNSTGAKSTIDVVA